LNTVVFPVMEGHHIIFLPHPLPAIMNSCTHHMCLAILRLLCAKLLRLLQTLIKSWMSIQWNTSISNTL